MMIFVQYKNENKKWKARFDVFVNSNLQQLLSRKSNSKQSQMNFPDPNNPYRADIENNSQQPSSTYVHHRVMLPEQPPRLGIDIHEDTIPHDQRQNYASQLTNRSIEIEGRNQANHSPNKGVGRQLFGFPPEMQPRMYGDATSPKNGPIEGRGRRQSAVDILDMALSQSSAIPYANHSSIKPHQDKKIEMSAVDLLMSSSGTYGREQHAQFRNNTVANEYISTDIKRTPSISFNQLKSKLAEDARHPSVNETKQIQGYQLRMNDSQDIGQMKRFKQQFGVDSHIKSRIVTEEQYEIDRSNLKVKQPTNAEVQRKRSPSKGRISVVSLQVRQQQKVDIKYGNEQRIQELGVQKPHERVSGQPINIKELKSIDLLVIQTPKNSPGIRKAQQVDRNRNNGDQLTYSKTQDERFFKRGPEKNSGRGISRVDPNNIVYNATMDVRSRSNEARQPQLPPRENQNSNLETDEVHPMSRSITMSAIKKNPNSNSSMRQTSFISPQVHTEGPITFSEPFQERVPCNKTVTRFAEDSNKSGQTQQRRRQQISHVIIEKHQIVHKSFFMPDYVMYHLEVSFNTDPYNFNHSNMGGRGVSLPAFRSIQKSKIVKRNYQDFQRFRAILQKQYPGFHLPFLQTNSWLSETNIDFVRRQKMMLEFFLNDLISNPFLKNSVLLHEFLTIEDHKTMKRTFEKYENQKKFYVKAIQQLAIPQQYVQVRLNQEQKIFADYLRSYLAFMGTSFQRLNDLFDNISASFQSISGNMQSVSELMRAMQTRTLKFNSNVTCNFMPESLPQLCRKVRQMYAVQSQKNHLHHQVLHQQLCPLLRYEHSNILNLQTLLGHRDLFTKHFLRRMNEEVRQLQSYPSHGIQVYLSERCQHGKKTGQGLLEQNRDILVNKYQTAFLNTQVCTEAERVFTEVAAKISIKFDQISKSHIQGLLEQHHSLQQILYGRPSVNEII